MEAQKTGTFEGSAGGGSWRRTRSSPAGDLGRKGQATQSCLHQPSPLSAAVIHAVAGPPDRGRERPGAQRRVGLTPEPCDVTILQSLPGVGRIVLATLLAEAFEALQRRSYQALRCLAGVAPVTKRSGKSRIVLKRQAAQVSVVHGSGEWTHWPQPRPGLGDTDVGRASQVLHTIEHVGGDVHLGRPTLIRMRAYPVADHLFPSRDGALG